MALASALAAGAACVRQHKSALVVQTPLSPLNRDCTSYGSNSLAADAIFSLFKQLAPCGVDPIPREIATALRELVVKMVAMADGTAPPRFFLSSLDPGVGKTTALVHFLRSEQHEGVAVLLCLSRLEEITRLVEDMGLNEADFAVLSSDEGMNGLSTTPPREARVLFTTHAMVKSRCKGRQFRTAEAFHFQGEVRSVPIWDEEMLPGEVVSLDTDQLASLRDPLRLSHPSLAGLIEGLESDLRAAGCGGSIAWPKVEEATGVTLFAAQRGLEPRHASYLDALYALSGRDVLLRKPHNAKTVISALDTRDAIPDDLAPVVVLDASGRVRETYAQWQRTTGKLVRLPSAKKSYRNLVVHVMDNASGKTAWNSNAAGLALEVARKIDSKPEEEWLVVYHKGANGGRIPEQIKGLLDTNPDRVRFLNWGKHQGTNDYRHIRNVILAGLINYRQTDYEMMARYYGGISSDQEAPKALISEIEAGEHRHHVLQALCRASVRQGSGAECGPCNAYIIAPKRSRVRSLLRKTFPGCEVRSWSPVKQKAPTGQVAKAIEIVKARFSENPDSPFMLLDLRDALGITDISNFKRRIREHKAFKSALEQMGVEEVTIGKGANKNALEMTWKGVALVEGPD